MKTYKLWFEHDPLIPEFKQLHFAEADVSVKEIIQRGIYPKSMEQDFFSSDSFGLNTFTIEILNDKRMKIPGFTEFGYCENISEVSSYFFGRNNFEMNAKKIADNICFIDDLDYPALFTLAKRRLTETWSHKVAVNLAQQVYPDFNDLRDFLKKKDKTIKLSGYKDLKKYEIHTIVSLDDFEGHDKTIIACGIQWPNFRKTDFLRKITTSDGYLSLIDGFDRFSLVISEDENEITFELTCRCRRKDNEVYIMPDIDNDERKRRMAREFAENWSNNTGKLCFTVSLDTIVDMIEKTDIRISFEGIRYTGSNDCHIPYIKANGPILERYVVGKHPTFKSTNEEIKEILQKHGVSMTGKKEKLIDKLAKRSVFLYSELNDTLNNYFIPRKFVKIPRLKDDQEKFFPLLENLDLGQMVLAMYILRHLRGNAILEAIHVNDTYELTDLARALMYGKIEVDGVFVKVENIKNGGNKNENSPHY